MKQTNKPRLSKTKVPEKDSIPTSISSQVNMDMLGENEGSRDHIPYSIGMVI